MNKQVGIQAEKPAGLALLREPFPPHHISKLPKPTRRQTDEVKADFKKGIRCKECGQWHHPDVVHLDYVGHAALTDRLLDCDPEWNWEPMARTPEGAPMLDANGGMWIKLTICGVSRFGYGHPDGKNGGDAVKEVIGDALRNAAMRFGAALDLWHKGQLHAEADDPPVVEQNRPTPRQQDTRPAAGEAIRNAISNLRAADDVDDLGQIWGDLPNSIKSQPAVIDAKDEMKAKFAAESPLEQALDGSEIPY